MNNTLLDKLLEQDLDIGDADFGVPEVPTTSAMYQVLDRVCGPPNFGEMSYRELFRQLAVDPRYPFAAQALISAGYITIAPGLARSTMAGKKAWEDWLHNEPARESMATIESMLDELVAAEDRNV